ncbi:2,3-diaminopropionate biosynthesis protein SbnB [Glycomyces buryatensis]|uniref:2,3-diaminopropionate biosynthesis protein SbnB n=1 Tax=Glycomyces buryatensis TaxID=2570927 RepID=A0A4V4HRF7_9ACTN|nr:2,3-diaminopropionate biosynthesis protein SbnB [Glycomyces buryatensis]
MIAAPAFHVIPGIAVRRLLRGGSKEVIDAVDAAYRLHGEKNTVNPPSHFLRYPDHPANRIIALPASLGGDEGVDGLKWISSFPANIKQGLPRASAVLILNDQKTGYPFACLESSVISATRTAASAALMARKLTESRGRPRSIGIVGTGLIARYILEFLLADGCKPEQLVLFDKDHRQAESFAQKVLGGSDLDALVVNRPESVVRSCDLVVLATTTARPYLHGRSLLDNSPVILNVSLRDIGPALVLDSVNIVDDVAHVFQAGTSVHLTESLVGHRDFVDAEVHDVLEGWAPPPDRPVVFSPFGLGVLDLAVGALVYRRAMQEGLATEIPGFHGELERHRPLGALNED